MKFSVAAILASAASVLAQTEGFLSVHAPNGTAGSLFHFTWTAPSTTYANQDVIITLIGGSAQDAQNPIQELGTVNSNELKFDWTAPADWGSLNYYGLTVKLASNPSIMQYSNPFFNIAETTTTSAATAPYGTKTISLSTQSAVYTAPAGGYTTVVEVEKTTTVPCANGTVPTSSAPYYAPPAATHPVVSVPYNNATFSTAYVPPASTGPSSPYSPPVSTPVATPVTGAGARFAAPVAAVAGIFVAVFAL